MNNEHSETPFPESESGTPGDRDRNDASSVETGRDLETELETARAEAADWHDKYLRKLAEFDNFRKRTRQEAELLRLIGTESLVLSLLPVLDDFDRTLTGFGNTEDPFRRGVELIRDKLRMFLDQQGVQRMECVGKPFHPDEHDALMVRSTPDFPPGTVLEEILPGYRMRDRVIRHAQVIVSAEPTDDSSPSSNDNVSSDAS